MVREVKKWSEIRIRDRIAAKSWSVYPIRRPNHNTKFQWNRLITFAVIQFTDNEWHTNRPDRITCALGEVIMRQRVRGVNIHIVDLVNL